MGDAVPEDGQIDWSLPADEVRNLVRAVTQPYPGAFSFPGRQEMPDLVGDDNAVDRAETRTSGDGRLHRSSGRGLWLR